MFHSYVSCASLTIVTVIVSGTVVRDKRRPSVVTHPQHRSIILNVLRRTQCLLADPRGCELHDTTQSALVGGHQQAGQCPLKRAGGLDGAQGLDGADECAALEYDAVGRVVSPVPVRARLQLSAIA